MKRVLRKLFDRRDWRPSLLLSRIFVAVVAAVVVWAVVGALGDGGQQPMGDGPPANVSPQEQGEAAMELPVAGIVGAEECEAFAVYAQGRWAPYGATVRRGPSITTTRVAAITPNVAIPVDGWATTDAAYPDNPDPWNSPVWFHLTDGTGWVSFPGVRSTPSDPQGTDGPAGGGSPVELAPECEGQPTTP